MRTRMVPVLIVTLLLAAVFSGPAPQAQDGPVLAAMRDELARSMKELRLRDEPPPYFIEYEVVDSSAMRVAATLGGLVDDTASRSRTIRVEVRVGDHAFDNTNFAAPGRGGVVPLSPDGTVIAPLDDDYDTMRRQIWLATDAAYKRAVSIFARKKAAFQNRAGGPTLPDFSKEKPTEIELPRPTTTPAGREWAERVKSLSLLFGKNLFIHNSDVSAYEIRGTRYYLNSEGSKTVSPVQVASVRVNAETQTGDGMILRDGFSTMERTLADAGTMEELSRRIREASERLFVARGSRLGDEFAGPVMIEGRASGEFISQSLAALMVANRPPESDGGGRGGPQQGPAPPFLNRIGLRVLPDPFSVTDTPSLKEFNGRPVPGAYDVDHEGVPAKDVSLVEKGRLLTLLTSRTPQRNLLQSNGHGRSNSVQPGVLQLSSAQAIPAAQMKARYLELLKLQERPFGYIIRGISDGPRQPGGGPAIADVVRIDANGTETPVRGLRFGSVPPTTFRDIAEASTERSIYNFRTGSTTIASVIVPSLIFEELEIQRTRDVAQRPPVVRSPLQP